MKGILYGVGVGPGDPELLTLKAVRTIEACDVVAAPDSGGKEQLALRIAAAHTHGKELLLCHLPMTRNEAVRDAAYQAAAAAICRTLEAGKDVAFLTLGDPSIYATYGYLHRMVEEAGYRVCIVPGVPSFCAAAAALGEPLCEGNMPLHILPAAWDGLSQALDQEGGKVIMKMGKKRDEVLALLRKKDIRDAVMVERCTLPEEVVRQGLEEMEDGDGYFALLVVKGGRR